VPRSATRRARASSSTAAATRCTIAAPDRHICEIEDIWSLYTYAMFGISRMTTSTASSALSLPPREHTSLSNTRGTTVSGYTAVDVGVSSVSLRAGGTARAESTVRSGEVEVRDRRCDPARWLYITAKLK
jgi:hypothetical protein